MASTWTENGPVSLPPRSLVYSVAVVALLLAVAGVGLGLRAAWREPAAPGLADEAGGSDDSAIAARPIVELPPPVAAPTPAKDDSNTAQNVTAEDKALAAQTAAAQAIQAKTSKSSGDIDTILTSASEKPPAPVKPTADEAPPQDPTKSDVPF